MNNESACKHVRAILAKNLRECRKKAHLSQQQLAYSAGINRTYLSDLENENANASVDMLVKVSEALDVSLLSLFKGLEPAVDVVLETLAQTKDGSFR